MIKKIIIFTLVMTASQLYGQHPYAQVLLRLSGEPNIKIGKTETFTLIYHPEDPIRQGNVEPKDIKKISYAFAKKDSHLKAEEGKNKAEILVTAEKGAKADILDVDGFFTKPKKVSKHFNR